MPYDEFDNGLPFLVQAIDPITFFMLNNITHQKIQCMHQTTRPKNVRMSISLMFFNRRLPMCLADATKDEESWDARKIAPLVNTQRTFIKCWFLTFVPLPNIMETTLSEHSSVIHPRPL
jgi:hypothetical protein